MNQAANELAQAKQQLAEAIRAKNHRETMRLVEIVAEASRKAALKSDD